ncbi:hypothetical protein [Sphingobacterium sp. HMA12]|uniref:hypothetical protein n=1 Tax=Sphingobacterium sp. HMA12 TaxID=2050894 RepID=UPI0013157728|nr:hypothetical protein [Sphingobacterium sp. HMA12]
MKNTDRKIYISPRIETMEVELEQGIAAGSAAPADTFGNDPQESWNKGDDDSRLINW